MVHKPDIEQWLKQSRLHSTINADHKRDLWLTLVSHANAPHLLTKSAWAFSLAAVTTVVVLIIVLNQSQLVAQSEWTLHTTETKPMHQGVLYHTHNHEVLVTLDDASSINISPRSSFTIESSSTSRKEVDCVIVLHKGTLEASASHELPHDLIVRTPNVELTVIGTKFVVTVSEQAL